MGIQLNFIKKWSKIIEASPNIVMMEGIVLAQMIDENIIRLTSSLQIYSSTARQVILMVPFLLSQY